MSAVRCCVCGDRATRLIVTCPACDTVGQTLYCDRHAAELLEEARHEHGPWRCEHAEVRVFRSEPPHAKCLQCGARVKQVWVAED